MKKIKLINASRQNRLFPAFLATHSFFYVFYLFIYLFAGLQILSLDAAHYNAFADTSAENQARSNSAQLIDPFDSPFKSEITYERLTTGIEALMRFPEMQKIREFGRENNVRIWFLGGSASSIAEAIKVHRAWEPDSPIHQTMSSRTRMRSIFSFLQDIDLVVDGDYAMTLKLKQFMDREFPYVLRVEEAEGAYKKKYLWEVMTLHQHNGRGLVGDFNFLNQDSDTYSMGLVEITPTTPNQVVKYIPEWENITGDNPFTRDLLSNQIHFFRRQNHSNTLMYKRGKNPEIIAVLRFLTKAFRYHKPISAENEQALREIINLPESQNFSEFNEYIQQKIAILAHQMIYDAWDTAYAVETLIKLNLLGRLTRWLKPTPEQINAKSSFQHLVKTIITHPELRSFHPWRYTHRNLQSFEPLPNHSIIEGTTLWGGQRAPLFFQNDTPEVKNFIANAEATVPSLTPKSKGLIHQLAGYTQSYSESTGLKPGFFILPGSFNCHHDCRDYALNFHIVADHYRIPTQFHFAQYMSRNIAQLGEGTEAETFLVNPHIESADVTHDIPATDYSLSVWTLNPDMDRLYGQYRYTDWYEWITSGITEAKPEILMLLAETPELLEYFDINADQWVDTYIHPGLAQDWDIINGNESNSTEQRAQLAFLWFNHLKKQMSGPHSERTNQAAFKAISDLVTQLNKSGKIIQSTWLYRAANQIPIKTTLLAQVPESVAILNQLLFLKYGLFSSVDAAKGQEIIEEFRFLWKNWTHHEFRHALLTVFLPYFKYPMLADAVMEELKTLSPTLIHPDASELAIAQNQLPQFCSLLLRSKR